MIFLANIKNNKIEIANKPALKKYLSDLPDCRIEIQIKKISKKRTMSQNSALHLYFGLLADALNSAGFDMKKTINSNVDIPWSTINVKEYLWRPIQVEYLQKRSTTKLETKDIDMIFDIVNKAIGERTGIFVPFPSRDDIY